MDHPAPLHHLAPDTILHKRYKIDHALGEGGFGITYVGADILLNTKVAVKEYFPAGKTIRKGFQVEPVSLVDAQHDFETGKSRFLREARLIAQMEKQPEIVGVRDYFEENGTAYIVMEYIEGETLLELVEKNGAMPVSKVLELFRPLFSALSALHEADLLHRDISPDNLMVENGSLRLMDFGGARELVTDERTMTVSVKQGYAPIEQYQQGGQGPWTDVYALGGTLYFCMTGKKPPQALSRIVKDELVPPSKLGADLSHEQEKALLCALAQKPRQRFQTMEAFYQALYSPKRRRFQGKKLALLLAACIVLTGITTLFLFDRFPGFFAVEPTSLPVCASEIDWEAFWTDDSTYVYSSEEFLSALADPAVDSVVVTGHIAVENHSEDILRMEKPVLITAEGGLDIPSSVEITGNKGRLQVNGPCFLHAAGPIRIVDGGKVFSNIHVSIPNAGIRSDSLVVFQNEEMDFHGNGRVYAPKTIVLEPED